MRQAEEELMEHKRRQQQLREESLGRCPEGHQFIAHVTGIDDSSCMYCGVSVTGVHLLLLLPMHVQEGRVVGLCARLRKEAYVTGIGDDVSALEAWSSRCGIPCLLGAWIDCYCFTRHVQHLPPCEMRFKSRFEGPIKVFLGIFMKYSLNGRESCSGVLYPLPLYTKREATSGENFKKHFQKKKEKPEIQVQILKLDKSTVVLREITCIGIMLLQGRNSMFRTTTIF